MADKKSEQGLLTRILFDYRVMILLGVLLLAAVFLFVTESDRQQPDEQVRPGFPRAAPDQADADQ
jgi:hypothetical protein